MSRTCWRLWTSFFAGLLLTFGLFSESGIAAADKSRSVVEWSRDYGSRSEGEGVIPTSDGGYLAVGSIYDTDGTSGYSYPKAYVLKLDAEGGVEWERKLKYRATRNSAYRAIETKEGGYLVAGTSVSEGEPKDQLYIIRLDSAGKVLWEKVQEDDAIHSTPKAIAETGDGSFLIAGEGMISWLAYEQGYILKIDPDGNTLWYNKYRFTGTGDYLTDLVPGSDGGYIAVGHAGMAEYESQEFDAMLMMKIDDQGKVLWSKPFVDPRSGWTAYSVTGAGDGGYAVLSRKSIDDTTVTVLTKTDASGQVQWEKTYRDGTDSEHLTRLVRTKDGYAMLGRHSSSGRTEYDVLSVDANGGYIARELFKGPPIYGVGTAAATPDGGFVFAGTVARGDVTKLQLMKLSPPEERPSGERMLTGIAFTEKEKKVKAGASVPTVLQAVYSDGTTSDLSIAAVYVSEDESIADVDALGWITGHEPGSTSIEAHYAGYTARLDVTVWPEDTDEFDPVDGSLSLDSGEYSLSEGTMLDIKVFYYDYKTQTKTDITKQVRFRSSKPDIAEVDGEGNLIGHKAGAARIYADYKGSSVYAEVLVVRAAAPKDAHPDAEGTENGTVGSGTEHAEDPELPVTGLEANP